MRIVVDTNVLISGVFFGGNSAEVLKAIISGKVIGFANNEVINEYQRVIEEFLRRGSHKFNSDILFSFYACLENVDGVTFIGLCRDKDDDKFLNCSIDSNAEFLITGDNDLLVLKEIGKTRIVNARQFCEEYLR